MTDWLSVSSCQARRFKSAVCEGEGHEVRDGTENRVIYFSKEEARTVNAR